MEPSSIRSFSNAASTFVRCCDSTQCEEFKAAVSALGSKILIITELERQIKTLKSIIDSMREANNG